MVNQNMQPKDRSMPEERAKCREMIRHFNVLADPVEIMEDAERLASIKLFDLDFYIRANPDIAQFKDYADLHYLAAGADEKRVPNGWFDIDFYCEQLEKAAIDVKNHHLLLHYAETGWKNGFDPHPGFSAKAYLSLNNDVRENGQEPLSHYIFYGLQENRPTRLSAHASQTYVQYVEDVARLRECGLLLPDFYLNAHIDLYGSEVDPFEHYILSGRKEGRRPNPWFDPQWYEKAYKKKLKGEDPLFHWIDKGALAGLDPSADFASDVYFKENKDIKKGKVDPLWHYITAGQKEGRGFPSVARRKKKAEKKKRVKLETAKISAKAKLPVPDDLRSLIDYERKPLAPRASTYNPKQLLIHWVIPDFAAGAGGHMTIFRMVHFLEQQGHKQVIWVQNPVFHSQDLDAYSTILKHFKHFVGDVKLLDKRFEKAEGDAIIATDCFSVWPVMSATKFKRRFYFVQDHEPSFHPIGSRSHAAEMTYHQDLDCICASPWLESMMRDTYGRWARSFYLAADQSLYYPATEKSKNKLLRIAVYARTFTARRLVELGMLALEVLARDGIKFHVDFFGAPLDLKECPFSFTDHGVAKPEQLADLFREADVGLVFSATNYSLVPQEMMASGLPIIENDGDNTRAIFPEDVVTFTKSDPIAIAAALKSLLQDPGRRQAQAKKALDWVSNFSWEKSARLVEKALLDRLAEIAQPVSVEPKIRSRMGSRAPKKGGHKASIVIPTLNPGKVFKKVLAGALSQEAKFDYEILVIDSGSTDGTIEFIQGTPGVRLHQIDKKDFNHGGTRNLGVELTDGEYVAFLTHDALPYNEEWLSNLVTGMDRFPKAGGVFGRHMAWPDASPFTKRDLTAHFDSFNDVPVYLDAKTDKKLFQERVDTWMQKLHFYSDNNSMLRRSVWNKVPMRRTQFGEDHLYAYDIIMAGYGKLYMPQAVVYHSHDYDAEETRERCMIESAFFKHFFGYRLMDNLTQVEQAWRAMNEHDEHWALMNNISKPEVKLQSELVKARLIGHLQGSLADTSDMF